MLKYIEAMAPIELPHKGFSLINAAAKSEAVHSLSIAKSRKYLQDPIGNIDSECIQRTIAW